MPPRPFLRLFCLLGALSLAMPAYADVFTSPTDPKPGNSNGGQLQGTLQAIVQLTSQNRGADALTVLTNSVDTGVISSDHHSTSLMNPQDLAVYQLFQSGQPLTPAQVMQLVTRLSIARRGDEAVVLYNNALQSGVIRANP